MKQVKISLAGDLGSGKSTVGKVLEKQFGLRYYSTGTIQREIAEGMGMTPLQLNRYMETHPEIDQKIDDGLRALERAEAGLVIDSRMAWHFVPSSFAVYMMAAPLVAAARILAAGRANESFSTLEEAASSVAARRESEARRYKDMYGVDICDLDNYDYVIDTSFVSPDTVAAHIAAHLQMFAAGKSFARYEICPARLLPAGSEAGAPAFAESGGFFYIVSGADAVAQAISRGEPLVACSRCALEDAAAFARENCTEEKVESWVRRTGVTPAALPPFLQR